VAEPEWSGAHKGLCTYVARLLQPVWEEPIVVPIQSSSSAAFACSLPAVTLEVTPPPPAAFLEPKGSSSS